MPDLNSIPSSSQAAVTPRARRTSSAQHDQHQNQNQGQSQSQSQSLNQNQNQQIPQQVLPPPSNHNSTSTSTAHSLNLLPSNQPAFQEGPPGYLSSPPLSSASTMAPPLVPGQDNAGVGPGPGPLRHPRPLTAAELHSQLEQEQELLVNRLSRDLTLLRRAQNSSALSNASSTSTSYAAIDPLGPSSFTDPHFMSGPGFPPPTSRRHHRTSSSASTRSLSLIRGPSAVAGSFAGSPAPSIPLSQSHPGSAAAVLEAARNPRGPASMSRQNSTTSHRSSSRNRSPQPYAAGSGPLPSQPHGMPQDYAPGYFSRDRTSSNASIAATPGSDLSPGLLPATVRYEETIHYRNELEAARRENEALKKRVRALEKSLKEQRESDSELSRMRSESTGTTSSVSVSVSGTTGIGGAVGGGTSIAGDRRDERRSTDRSTGPVDIAVGVPDLELKVGESAATATVSPDLSQMESHETK